MRGDGGEKGDYNRAGDRDPLLRLDTQKGEEKIRPLFLALLSTPHSRDALTTSKQEDAHGRETRRRRRSRGSEEGVLSWEKNNEPKGGEGTRGYEGQPFFSSVCCSLVKVDLGG